ncbi:GDSL-type esterase/lipase family protein [Paenibacillus sp. LHD-117]|uniref:GDSL-type esterase/lipase family protein n=1 Tax=Paenibacillus sp. LHD-117 TaxID=3071412 RepID=UPI0027DF5154|nr:GDSL-type esterase/lipase family protein [Paenibacillus sp. LHD-117]MDQ6423422.1 GDSL-type esterase/lipase family protein [Paenibacillus sp. LHD-117]
MKHSNETINTATIPVPKLEEDCYDWWERHEQVLREQAAINPEIVLIGDSITHFWGGEPRTNGIQVATDSWNAVFAPYRVLNLGFGWDRTQNVLWRLDHGEMKELSPRTVVIMIGTNNTSETENARANGAEEIAEGLKAICDRVETLAPQAQIIVMAVLPREQHLDHPRRELIQQINVRYTEIAKERHYRFVDIGPRLLETDGTLSAQTAPDFCHLSEQGYRRWAEALRPLL